MHLEEMEVAGFKSFATKTIFRFDRGITAIIGPNGSGKSNLAEAVRWVLGEQSLKQLRGHKAADVIFAGSKTRARANQARVSLTLNNESGRFPVPAAEVRLARWLNRTGESEYSINGDPVRLLDMQQLLAEAGLGAKSYAVISQGTVDRYLVASPAARRELFDEACGIKALQMKLNQTERRLERARQKQEELALVMREMEPRLRILKRQVRQHEEKERLQAEFNEKQELWFQQEWGRRFQSSQEADRAWEEAKMTADTARITRKSAEGDIFATLTRVSQGGTAEELLVLKRHQLEQMKQAQAFSRVRKAALAALTTCEVLFGKIRRKEMVRKSELEEAEAMIAKVKAGLEHKPSRDKVRQLEGEIAELESHESVPSDYDVLEDTLNEAREQELTAERHTSAAEAASQSAREDLRELEDEILREKGSKFLGEVQRQDKGPVLAGIAEEEIRQLGARLATLGEIDPVTLKEYEETKARYELMQAQTQDAEAAWKNTKRLANQIKREINERFKTQFQTIQREFKQYFEKLFGGGEAKMELVEETVSAENDEEKRVAGIEITAQPPGKKTTSLQLLSGGEKALTSLALLLAIVKIQQPPFLVLDEVDAALDEANSWRFAEAARTISQTTQCIVVTHNREMMGGADVLYGITMNKDGVSRAYSVRMDEIAETAGGGLDLEKELG